MFGIPLSRHRPLRLSDGSELLFGVWCYLFFIGGMPPSCETSQQAIVLPFADNELQNPQKL